MVSAERREARDLLRARLQLVVQQTRVQNTITGLLAQYNVTAPKALPALAQLRVRFLTEQLTLLAAQSKTLVQELVPLLVPEADVQRLLWIPGVGKLAAFTLILEIDGIERFPSPRDFVSYCRLVPGAGNSGGKTGHKRSKDGNRYLKLIFTHLQGETTQSHEAAEVATPGEPASLTGAVRASRPSVQLRCK